MVDVVGDYGLIFVVDDDVVLVEMFQFVFIKEGFLMVGVGYGSDVMDVFCEYWFVLVFFDFMLFGCDGIWICQDI